MKTKLDYQIRDNFCAKALKEFKALRSVPLWIENNSNLFDSISIKPEGLPRITDSNLEGETYENIQRFARLYEIVSSLF